MGKGIESEGGAILYGVVQEGLSEKGVVQLTRNLNEESTSVPISGTVFRAEGTANVKGLTWECL